MYGPCSGQGFSIKERTHGHRPQCGYCGGWVEVEEDIRGIHGDEKKIKKKRFEKCLGEIDKKMHYF